MPSADLLLTDYRNLLPGTATVTRRWRVPRRNLADGRHRQLCNSRSQERSKVTADRFEVYLRCFASIAALSSFFIGCVIFPCRFSCVRVRRSHHQSCSERMCCPEVAPTTHTPNQTDMNRSKRGSVNICFALERDGVCDACAMGIPNVCASGKAVTVCEVLRRKQTSARGYVIRTPRKYLTQLSSCRESTFCALVRPIIGSPHFFWELFHSSWLLRSYQFVILAQQY